MGQHGLINWADDDKECYDLSLELIEKAARYIAENDKGEKDLWRREIPDAARGKAPRTFVQILPWLRGKVSAQQRWIGTIQDDEAVLRFVNSKDAPRLAELGTSCPDHFLRTKIKPLYVDWNPQTEDVAALKKKLGAGLEHYRKDYAAYYEKCKHADSPAMRNPNPTVILIPGLGLIAWGKDKSESRVTAEFYNCAIEVMRGAEAIDEYIALPLQEAFDIEYWLLEEAKLKRMPAEKELARQIIAVIGAGSGIGREVALRIAPEGAHVVCVDVNAAAAESDGEGDHRQAGARHRRGGQRHLRIADRPSGWPATSRNAKASARCSSRSCSPTAASIRHRADRGHFRPARHGRPHRGREMGAHLRHQRDRQLPRGRRGAPALEGAGAQGEPRAHHQRQRGRGEERAASPTT